MGSIMPGTLADGPNTIRGVIVPKIAVIIVSAAFATVSAACPFCDIVGRPLAARRDAASVVAVGEAAGDAHNDGGVILQPFVVQSVIRGDRLDAGDMVQARVPGKVTGTAMVFGERDGAESVRFEAVAADEMLLGYIATAPATEAPAAERLRWFARWLEHPERAIAEDAFMEFGLAPFGDVVRAADALDAHKLRRWLDEPAIDQRRRGFYGLAVGIMAAKARADRDITEADACLTSLERAIDAPANDFRAGYDGLLGGLLVAKGEAAIDGMAALGLLSDTTRAGDARHALAALRFAWELLPDRVPRERVSDAVAGLVRNPAVAADAVIDLARYEHWASLDAVVTLWEPVGHDDPLVRRAIAGFLMACPLQTAKDHAAKIAADDPEPWAAAVQAAGLPARKVD